MTLRRSLRWLGTAALAGSLATGCRHARNREDWAQTVVEPGPTTGEVIMDGKYPTVPATPMPEEMPKPPNSLPAAKPDKDKEPAPSAAPAMELSSSEPVFHQTGAERREAVPSSPGKTDLHPAAVQSATLPSSQDPLHDLALPGAGGNPVYAHAADYTWLVGELYQLKSQNVWLLRYAPIDQNDAHGGSVTLVGVGWAGALHEGQIVRVEGALINPDSRRLNPAFRVRAIKPVNNP
jgi:hypothetical protein